MMAIPNLIGLIILGPMVFKATKTYWEKRAIKPQKIG